MCGFKYRSAVSSTVASSHAPGLPVPSAAGAGTDAAGGSTNGSPTAPERVLPACRRATAEPRLSPRLVCGLDHEECKKQRTASGDERSQAPAVACHPPIWVTSAPLVARRSGAVTTTTLAPCDFAFTVTAENSCRAAPSSNGASLPVVPVARADGPKPADCDDRCHTLYACAPFVR